MTIRTQKPAWLRTRLPPGADYERVRALMRRCGLHTVCQEAKCPNLWECFSNQTATFMILGAQCTRNCRFCAVGHGFPVPLDIREPVRVAQAVEKLGLTYVVVTSVTRDDLPDGGAGVFAETIEEIRKIQPKVHIEVLIPDFQGNEDALRTVISALPNVLNHNLETVHRLYPSVRPEAVYDRSLELLCRVRQFAQNMVTKSGLMLGLGETETEVIDALKDLRGSGCRIVTLGQYLQPSKAHLPVQRFVPPKEFADWREKALGLGFLDVAAGPLVRSSYHAHDIYRRVAGSD